MLLHILYSEETCNQDRLLPAFFDIIDLMTTLYPVKFSSQNFVFTPKRLYKIYERGVTLPVRQSLNRSVGKFCDSFIRDSCVH